MEVDFIYYIKLFSSSVGVYSTDIRLSPNKNVVLHTLPQCIKCEMQHIHMFCWAARLSGW